MARIAKAMKRVREMFVILVTTPDLKAARKIAQAVLKKRLAACANIVPRIESHYWWQEKLETGAEALILFKTTRARLAALEATVLAAHPYETPEIVALPLQSGIARYLEWLAGSVGAK